VRGWSLGDKVVLPTPGQTPYFRLLKQSNYHRLPLFLHAVVALGLQWKV
jgi:hypothetical protein